MEFAGKSRAPGPTRPPGWYAEGIFPCPVAATKSTRNRGFAPNTSSRPRYNLRKTQNVTAFPAARIPPDAVDLPSELPAIGKLSIADRHSEHPPRKDSRRPAGQLEPVLSGMFDVTGPAGRYRGETLPDRNAGVLDGGPLRTVREITVVGRVSRPVLQTRKLILDQC